MRTYSRVALVETGATVAAGAVWAWWLTDGGTIDELPQEGEDAPAGDPATLASSRAVESWGYDRGPPS